MEQTVPAGFFTLVAARPSPDYNVVRPREDARRTERLETRMAANLKNELHSLADELPDSATWEDVIEAARFRRAVDAGVAAADRGAFASDEQVKDAFSRLGVNVEG